MDNRNSRATISDTPRYVIRDPHQRNLQFVRWNMNGERWEIDMQIPSLIRGGTIRLYRLINPIPRYASYQFAAVNDSDEPTLFQELRDNYAIDGFQHVRMSPTATISQLQWEEASDPVAADRSMRNSRENALRRIPAPPAAVAPPVGHQDTWSALLRAAAAPNDAPLAGYSYSNGTRTALQTLLNREEDDGAAAGAGAAQDPYYQGTLVALRSLLNATADPPPPPIAAESFANRARVLSWLAQDMYEEEEAAPAPSQTIPPPLTHVSQTMIQAAIQQNRQCPITLEAIKADTAVCVAPCYHVFERAGITRWLETSSTCPECRLACRL